MPCVTPCGCGPSQTLKSNIRSLEYVAEPRVDAQAAKAARVLAAHDEMRRHQRAQDPARYNIAVRDTTGRPLPALQTTASFTGGSAVFSPAATWNNSAVAGTMGPLTGAGAGPGLLAPSGLTGNTGTLRGTLTRRELV